jgi:hypothetical protein
VKNQLILVLTSIYNTTRLFDEHNYIVTRREYKRGKTHVLTTLLLEYLIRVLVVRVKRHSSAATLPSPSL